VLYRRVVQFVICRRALVLWGGLAAVLVGVAAACSGEQRGAAPDRLCSLADLRLTPGPLWSEKTGQHTGTIVVRNKSGSSCSLDGYPRLAFLDAQRRLLAFRVSHRGDQMIANRAPQKVTVLSRGRAYFVFNKYRCDVRAKATARYLRLTLAPGATAALVRLARYPIIDYCPQERPSTTITVSPFVSNLADAARGS